MTKQECVELAIDSNLNFSELDLQEMDRVEKEAGEPIDWWVGYVCCDTCEFAFVTFSALPPNADEPEWPIECSECRNMAVYWFPAEEEEEEE